MPRRCSAGRTWARGGNGWSRRRRGSIRRRFSRFRKGSTGLLETLRSRCTGPVAKLHIERLAAARANEPAPWLVEKAVPRRLVEFDHGDRVRRHATPIVEERDLAALHD